MRIQSLLHRVWSRHFTKKIAAFASYTRVSGFIQATLQNIYLCFVKRSSDVPYAMWKRTSQTVSHDYLDADSTLKDLAQAQRERLLSTAAWIKFSRYSLLL